MEEMGMLIRAREVGSGITIPIYPNAGIRVS
jgi:hypothetical protein